MDVNDPAAIAAIYGTNNPANSLKSPGLTSDAQPLSAPYASRNIAVAVKETGSSANTSDMLRQELERMQQESEEVKADLPVDEIAGTPLRTLGAAIPAQPNDTLRIEIVPDR